MRIRLHTSVAATVLCVAVAAPRGARGQPSVFLSLPIQQNMETAQLSQSIFNSMMAAEAGRSAGAGRSGGADRAGQRSAQRSTRFVPVAPTLLPEQARSVIADTGRARQTEAYVRRALGDYSRLIRERGIAPNDVARAASFLVITAFDNYRGVRLGDAERDAVREQVRRHFALDDTFQRLEPRRKQLLYEDYVLQAMHLNDLEVLAEDGHDAALRARARGLAAQALRDAFGASPDRLEVTTAGIRRR